MGRRKTDGSAQTGAERQKNYRDRKKLKIQTIVDEHGSLRNENYLLKKKNTSLREEARTKMFKMEKQYAVVKDENARLENEIAQLKDENAQNSRIIENLSTRVSSPSVFPPSIAPHTVFEGSHMRRSTSQTQRLNRHPAPLNLNGVEDEKQTLQNLRTQSPFAISRPSSRNSHPFRSLDNMRIPRSTEQRNEPYEQLPPVLDTGNYLPAETQLHNLPEFSRMLAAEENIEAVSQIPENPFAGQVPNDDFWSYSGDKECEKFGQTFPRLFC